MPQLRPLKLGIIGLCIGNMACGTCHVYVEPDRLDELEPPDEDELEMLDDLAQRKDNSRLTCQIIYQDVLEGLVMTVTPRSWAFDEPTRDITGRADIDLDEMGHVFDDEYYAKMMTKA